MTMNARLTTAALLLLITHATSIVAAPECRICPIPNTKLRDNVIPDTTDPPTTPRTCAEWDAYAAASRTDASFSCLELRSLLEQQCCDGLPPLYQCEAAVENTLGLLGGESGLNLYASEIPPITDGSAVDVGVLITVSHVEITDFGIGGGAIEATISLTLRWSDPRLAWNSTTTKSHGCSSISVSADKVWTPRLDLPGSTRLRIYSNGQVVQSLHATVRLSCISRAMGSSKLCSAGFADDDSGSGGARYYAAGLDFGEEFEGLPEYKLNTTGSAIRVEDAAEEQQLLQLELDFVPLVSECNICGYNNSSRLIGNGSIPVYPDIWLEDFPETRDWSCAQIDDLLQTIEVNDRRCLRGRAFYEEACCDDKRALYPCESSIHDTLVEMHNTITTPDPSPREDDIDFADFSSKDAIDVRLSLDIQHVLGVQIKSNSMELLASIDLDWYDKRLAWEPFIGGCNRVTYRASLDAEQTDIWVPNLELVNKIEGVREIPEAHASVRYDGRVSWRRTGVISASCDLSGIEKFPYDETSCYLEFGSTRNPLYDRVKYHASLEDIEFTKRLMDDSWNYQEYKLQHNKTQVILRTERLSGYDNEIIRIQLYFERATQYYFMMFVIMYMLFTYLSFGMFFIDYEAGERLGYGSSMLFVVVAQDITLAETTPVTEETLWINQLSFGSKLFMIIAIVQSVTVLFLYSRIMLVKNDAVTESNEENIEEMRSFVNNNGSYAESPGQNGLSLRIDEPVDISEKRSTEKNSFNKRRNRLQHCWQHAREGFLGLFSFIVGEGFHHDTSDIRRRIKRLRMADMAFAILFFLGYTIFIFVMRFAVL